MITLTKKEEKLIVSLQQKKFRKQEELFVVEGKKIVEEVIVSDLEVKYVVSTVEDGYNNDKGRICDENTMTRLSSLKTPPGILAVVKIPSTQLVESIITLVVDGIRDPGNLGTIIRTAEAMGVRSIILSPDTVDVYSPKVVQATMGSIFRVNFRYEDLPHFLTQEKSTPIYGAHLNGRDVYKEEIQSPCCLVLGSESHGIRSNVMEKISHPIKIPMEGKAESLNVSIATAILLGEFKRQLSKSE